MAERPMVLGIEHIAGFNMERVTRAALSLVEFAAAHGETEGIDLIIVGVSARDADRVREVIEDAFALEFNLQYRPAPSRDALPGETLEDLHPQDTTGDSPAAAAEDGR